MADISSLVAGLSKGLDNYLQKDQQTERDIYAAGAKKKSELNAEGDISPEYGRELFGAVSPELGQAAFNSLTQFQQANGRPMKMSEAKAIMDPVLTAFGSKQYLKAAKDAAEADKDEKEQDKLEKDYTGLLSKVVNARSGGLGLQDSKVNQAIDLRTLLNQYYDPKTKDFNIPSSQHAELALGLARLVSPTGQVGVELMKELRQKTGREALASALIYAGADPAQVGGPTQSVVKMFKESIDRQGMTAEKLRDRYMQGLKGLKPTRLKQDRADRLNKAQLTSSFNDFLHASPDYKEEIDTHKFDRVQVLSPDGKTKGTIPAEQLEEAIKAGYTQL